ncbi:sugar MFS transporter [Parapedobacter lycopersici]|uniref:sugar MFS transporter n=1 Tax=Parapedobacter lycopersici TaxID=1864939 RepID=UPI00214DDF7D|nr:sugar MFS transporter [Parapedobacter lycopersici]
MALLPHQNIPTGQTVSDRHYTPALIALAVLYFMMGFITCLNDTLVPFFKAGFTLSYAESALVQFYFFLTYALFSIPAGRMVEKVGYKRGMVFGFAVAGVGAFLFYPASIWHEYSLFLAALFVLAIGIVLLQVAANPYITVLGPPETASSRLTLIQGVGSLGTTTAPLFGAHFILSRLGDSGGASDAVSTPYLGIGLTLLVIALVLARLALPKVTAADDAQQDRDQPSRRIFSFRNLNLGTIGIFVYVGAEVAIGTFLTNYIADTLLIDEHQANNYVALYWGGMLVGRLIGAVLLRWIKPQRVLAGTATMALLLILTAIQSTGQVAVWTMVSVGLFNSVMFAIIFSLAVKGLGKYTTQASGLLSSAIVGGAVIPYLQGLLKDEFTWTIAFMLPLCCYVYLVFYGLHGYRTTTSPLK